MLNRVNDNHSPIVITQNDEARAVLMDIDSYQNMQKAFALLNIIKIFEDELRNGNFQTSDEVFNELSNTFFRK